MRTFPFGLSYFMSPGRSESPGVTLDLWVAARWSASQPTKASASIVIIRCFTLQLSDHQPHDARNVGGSQFLPRRYTMTRRAECALPYKSQRVQPSVCLVTISATANPSSIVAIHPIELVIGHALRGGVMAALHARNLAIGRAGPSAMVSPLDPLYPLLHRRAKSTDTWHR